MRISVKLSSSTLLSAAVFIILLAPAYFDASSFGPDTSAHHVVTVAEAPEAGTQFTSANQAADAYQWHRQ